MHPIRKQFRADHRFPFDLVYYDTKSVNKELPDHVHDWYELVYVYCGQGTFFIDHTFYEKRAGDWFVIPGNTIHRSFPLMEDPVTSTAIFFSPLLIQQASLGEPFSYLHLFETAKKQKAYRIEIPTSESLALQHMMEEMHAEWTAQHAGRRHAIVLLLHRILLRLNRCVRDGGRAAGSDIPVGPVWMKEILRTIDENPGGELGLSALARLAAVTPAHFSRVFKGLTGMNLTEYVAAKRIIRAKELLLSSDRNVSAIAAECGFESLPHFHRTFKKITGATPAAYKRERLAPAGD